MATSNTSPKAMAGAPDLSGDTAVIANGSGGGFTQERYQSLFAIGRGGMGSVEVALDRCPDGTERVVALKRLLPESARDPRRSEMFLREARLAAMLTHPNVVHAFAFGENNGELFLAMEYVEGESLSRVLAAARESAGPISPTLVATILAQVCDGLHAAHELRGATGEPLNVVHRDVSPHNVMIAFGGQVKVLDFGVAKFEATSQQTRSGEVKGKMAYMSPEQALGDNLDRRSDLFSVGAVLFECLAGRRMWGSGTDLEVMRRLALQDPPSLDQAMEAAPAPLVALFSRLTARDRNARPATAHDVAVELRAFADSSGHGGNVEIVGTLMDRLFRGEAASRRSLLADAIAQAPAAGAFALRRSFEPFSVVRSPAPGSPQAPSDAKVAAKGPSARRKSVSGAPALIAAVGAIAAIGAILTFGPLAQAPPLAKVTRLPPPVVAASAPILALPVPAPPSEVEPLEHAPAPVTASTAPPTGPARLAAAREPVMTAPFRPAPTAKPPAPSAPAPSIAAPSVAAPSSPKLPDVDPTPF
jgi:serine/threonine protein kinase